MAAQLRRRLVDADDIGPHGLAVRAPRHDEVAIVGPRALQVVDHQVSPVGVELAPHPLRVEPQLAGVPHQILVRERRLPLVQEIVHLPELALRGRRLRDLRGVLGVRVLLTQRKMPEHELDLASDLPQHLLQIRVGAAAKRALEIAVLHERDGSLHRSQGVVARPDGRSQQGHGDGTPSASRGASRCRMAPRWYAACAIAPIATPSASSSHTACVSTATSSVSYSRRSRAWRSAQAASSTLDTVQLRLRSRDVGWPRRPRVESARLELRWWMWPAMVVWPGPPACEAAAALTPLIVPKTPVPGDVSVK